MKTKKPNPEAVRAVMYEVVDNQLRSGEPPETGQTFERLLAEGHSPDEARQLLAAVMSSEVFRMLKHKRPFDGDGYVAALKRLPKLPWEP